MCNIYWCKIVYKEKQLVALVLVLSATSSTAGAFLE